MKKTKIQAVTLEISFFEAFFRVYTTRKFRLTYPLPPPTSVAGMFGAILGIHRNQFKNKLGKLFFGAKTLAPINISHELTTLRQYKGKWISISITSQMLHEPKFMLAMAGEKDKTQKLFKKIEEIVKTQRFAYLPFGGQNDYFIKNISSLSFEEVCHSKIVEGYVPADQVAGLATNKAQISILPLNSLPKPKEYCFVLNGKVKTKTPFLTTKKSKIPLHLLESFSIVQA